MNIFIPIGDVIEQSSGCDEDVSTADSPNQQSIVNCNNSPPEYNFQIDMTPERKLIFIGK